LKIGLSELGKKEYYTVFPFSKNLNLLDKGNWSSKKNCPAKSKAI